MSLKENKKERERARWSSKATLVLYVKNKKFCPFNQNSLFYIGISPKCWIWTSNSFFWKYIEKKGDQIHKAKATCFLFNWNMLKRILIEPISKRENENEYEDVPFFFGHIHINLYPSTSIPKINWDKPKLNERHN